MKIERSVLITGASTGIGYAIAENLCQRGWYVFAGYRNAEAKSSLTKLLGDNGEAVRLDVTSPTDITAAVAQIQQRLEPSSRFALVNNAGVAIAGPVEALSSAELRRSFDINFFGLAEMTRAALPLLRARHGRIVNISSISGKISFPGLSAYTSSKFAVEALSDALRLELKPLKVPVVLIEPGAVKTPIWDKSAKEFYEAHASYTPQMIELYGGILAGMEKAVARGKETGVASSLVAAAVEKALTARRPATRYLVGTEAKVAGTLKALLPDRWMDKFIEKMA